jgi:hypothetical protein
MLTVRDETVFIFECCGCYDLPIAMDAHCKWINADGGNLLPAVGGKV